MRDLQALFGLDGKVGIITGAGRGVGAALAFGLAGVGVAVCLGDIDERLVQARAQEITEAGGKAFGIYVDVGDAASVDRMVTVTVERW